MTQSYAENPQSFAVKDSNFAIPSPLVGVLTDDTTTRSSGCWDIEKEKTLLISKKPPRNSYDAKLRREPAKLR